MTIQQIRPEHATRPTSTRYRSALDEPDTAPVSAPTYVIACAVAAATVISLGEVYLLVMP
ncbi:hypothetical protein ACFVVM_32515 [Nocardia sp. NPDC058176]|uniref:hypothetical protein n=1 Tax=Nocardia sp. NPDC058176 TaxID=3346368 RepID=UPI0036D8AF71